jgi:energy-coupling factor transporter ATP-binding protein EcfA2
MRLLSLVYSECEGTPQEWRIDGLSLGARNLLVGKNASGKTRALNIVSGLARSLAGLQPPTISGNYEAVFAEDGKHMRYRLICEQEQVASELVSVEDIVRLNRGPGGEGTIWAEEIDGGKDVRFQTPPRELAAVVRRDAIQHRFLEPLYAWASSLRHYYFGTSLGKDHLAFFVEKAGRKPDDRDPNAVVPLYRQAEKEFGDQFRQALMVDMGHLDYQVEEVGLKAPISIRIVPGDLPGEVMGLYVKEKDLAGITDQHSMSQGMFRALSLLVHINYCQLAKKATCILIDDVGEGLDFDRSCRLIDLLRRKAEESRVQLLLSTNDRFVMNRVPLEEWLVLQRNGSRVQVRNYENSRDVFEEFKFTGLSNFSFLEMDFVSGPPREEVPAHE